MHCLLPELVLETVRLGDDKKDFKRRMGHRESFLFAVIFMLGFIGLEEVEGNNRASSRRGFLTSSLDPSGVLLRENLP